ncbi:MAG: hypothetical protein IJ802_06155, partial [Kiritimatiellae bacterium]|nr:hypothetical protein [Kiritimatiellia bacterium]
MRSIDILLKSVLRLLLALLQKKFPEFAGDGILPVVKSLVAKKRGWLEKNSALRELRRHGVSLRLAESRHRRFPATVETCRNNMAGYKMLRPSLGCSFWEYKLKQNEDPAIVEKDVLAEWRAYYDKRVEEEELAAIENLRNELWESIEKWI